MPAAEPGCASRDDRYRDGQVTHPDMFAAIRELHIAYQHPVRSTGEVAVHLWIEALGTSSLRWGLRIQSTERSPTPEGHRTVVKRSIPAPGAQASWTEETRAATTSLMRAVETTAS